MKLIANCEYACFGRTISTLVKEANKTDLSVEEIMLYNINMLMFKGDINEYVTKYRSKLAKKSHVKSRSRTKPRLIKSIESLIKYNFRKMGLCKKVKVKLLEHTEVNTSNEYVSMTLTKMKLPFKGFSIKTLIDNL